MGHEGYDLIAYHFEGIQWVHLHVVQRTGLGREGSYSLQIKGEVLKTINSMISQFAKVIKSCHTEVL